MVKRLKQPPTRPRVTLHEVAVLLETMRGENRAVSAAVQSVDAHVQIVDAHVESGGAGFLGSHLCDRLVARGEDVLCVTTSSRARSATSSTCSVGARGH